MCLVENSNCIFAPVALDLVAVNAFILYENLYNNLGKNRQIPSFLDRTTRTGNDLSGYRMAAVRRSPSSGTDVYLSMKEEFAEGVPS